jgi:hypothetical protein
VLVGLGTLLILALLLNHFLAPAAAPENRNEVDPDDYYFNFHPVTTGVPNSVVFTYNAEKAPTEEVYLQQSWDSRRREKLPRNRQSHTSIYYLPGFYQTKLVVDEQVVRERELYLKSEAWIAAVKTEEVPIYLPLEECLGDGRLAISADQLTDLGLELQPTPPRTVLTHVGALENLSSDNFRFSTRLRHDYAAGAGICQYAKVLLLLKNSVIIIPLSAPGCVAELELYAGGQWLKGSENDLSAFGVVGDTWLDLACEGIGGLLTFSVNGRQVFQLESIEDARDIIGIRYEFAGVGSVDELTFSRGSEVVWAEGFDEMEASSF